MGQRQNRYQEKIRRQKRIRFLIGGAIVTVIVLGLVIYGAYFNGTSNVQTLTLGQTSSLKVNNSAPQASFVSLNGVSQNLSNYKGKPILLWLVTTWCSSCQAGTTQMKNYINELNGYNTVVLELENYNDLDQSGPPMGSFVSDLVGKTPSNWITGIASKKMTKLYNPQGLLDIYYLIDPSGKIISIGSAPTSNMGTILANLGSCC
jgi:thiol-disulfide isomerase/thioredoxin